MRIAYVTIGKADDIDEWSGLNAAIRAAMLQQGCIVDNVDQLGTTHPLARRIRKRLQAALLGTTYALDRSVAAAARWSEVAARRVATLPGVDAIVSTSTLPVAFLDSAAPIALWADATFHSLRSTYPDFASYSQASIKEGDRIERAALNRASLICYASEWAADDAISYYGISRQKIRVIPFGANCDPPFASEQEVALAVAGRDWSVTRFVFVGVDWHRKGGDLAVAVVRRLNEMGTPSLLTVIGCQPPAEVTQLPYVESLGFLAKKDAVARDHLNRALLRAHFLFVPTLAECFGLVFAEASAFALPSIARNVGGVAGAIRHGTTGLLLAADAGVEAYCQALQPLLGDRVRYATMSLDAYRDYSSRLNWQMAGARFSEALHGIVSLRAVTDRS